MENLPNCPKCNSEYTYEDGSLLVCPECAHEWNPSAQEEENVIKDVNGNVLNDGDSVTAVSYTHLDVYKRQIYSRSFCYKGISHYLRYLFHIRLHFVQLMTLVFLLHLYLQKMCIRDS